MSLNTDLDEAVAKIFREAWTVTDGTAVPDSTELTFSNTGRSLNATVLYADLAASTALVDGWVGEFAAKIYKTFLLVAARIIRNEGGAITAYDGDRIMAVFIGDSQRTSATRAAFRINWARANIIQPKLKEQYPNSTYTLSHTCGIDQSSIMAAKTGIRGSNDLVWVGRAANYAAKLSNESSATPTWITEAVYNQLNGSMKYGGDPKRDMWIPMTWTSMNDQRVYCSTWWQSFS